MNRFVGNEVAETALERFERELIRSIGVGLIRPIEGRRQRSPGLPPRAPGAAGYGLLAAAARGAGDRHAVGSSCPCHPRSVDDITSIPRLVTEERIRPVAQLFAHVEDPGPGMQGRDPR